MLKTVDFNDDAHQYIAKLEAENEILQHKINLLEDACHRLNYENEQAKKDTSLADAVRTIIKEWKSYDC